MTDKDGRTPDMKLGAFGLTSSCRRRLKTPKLASGLNAARDGSVIDRGGVVG
jgi:hypothetical protein